MIMKTYLSPVFNVVAIDKNDTIRTSGLLEARPSYSDDRNESGADFNALIGR